MRVFTPDLHQTPFSQPHSPKHPSRCHAGQQPRLVPERAACRARERALGRQAVCGFLAPAGRVRRRPLAAARRQERRLELGRGRRVILLLQLLGHRLIAFELHWQHAVVKDLVFIDARAASIHVGEVCETAERVPW